MWMDDANFQPHIHDAIIFEREKDDNNATNRIVERISREIERAGNSTPEISKSGNNNMSEISKKSGELVLNKTRGEHLARLPVLDSVPGLDFAGDLVSPLLEGLGDNLVNPLLEGLSENLINPLLSQLAKLVINEY